MCVCVCVCVSSHWHTQGGRGTVGLQPPQSNVKKEMCFVEQYERFYVIHTSTSIGHRNGPITRTLEY